MVEAVSSRARWLYGPWSDLLLGCGLLYLAIALVAGAYGSGFSAGLPSLVAPLIILLVSMPHYGATLLRVYERRADRRGYVAFALWATVAIVLAFGWAIFDSGFARLLASIYLTWSPWHYSGQNYGIAVMLLRRRGAAPSGLERKLLYAAFILSFSAMALVMHAPQQVPADPGGVDYADSAVRFVSLRIPERLLELAVPVVAAGQLAAAFGWMVLGWRRAGPGAIGPAVLLILSQTLWFTAPALARLWNVGGGTELLDWNSRPDYFVFIAGAHAAQYLWVTSYYARARPGWRGQLREFGKVAAAGVAVWTLPVIALAPGTSGRLEYGAGLALLVAAVVNIHHFVLDGAVWKLRSGPVARILIRAERGENGAAPEPGRGWARRAVWCVVALGFFLGAFVVADKDWLLARAVERRDLAATARSLDRLAWLGRDDSGQRDLLARRLAVDGELRAAAEQFEHSAALRPRAIAYQRLAEIYRRMGDADGVRRARERMSQLAPDS